MNALRFPILCVVLLSLVSSGCATTTIEKTKVYDHNRVKVLLRSKSKGGEAVNRGFQHPAQISEERMRVILSQIKFRKKDDGPDQKRGVFAPALIPNIAAGLSKALAEADSNQEVAVIAVHKHYSLGVFTRKTLTSFVSYVEGDELFVLFSRVDWDLKRRSDKGGSQVILPEPQTNHQVMKFRILASAPLAKAGGQGVRTAWRDSHWGPAEPEPARSAATSALVEERKALDEAPLPYPTTPAGLRALADLEEAREAGTISEAEYREARRALAQ